MECKSTLDKVLESIKSSNELNKTHLNKAHSQVKQVEAARDRIKKDSEDDNIDAARVLRDMINQKGTKTLKPCL